DEVAAVEHRDAREPAKGRGHEIEVVSDTGRARVGIEPGEHRVAVFAGTDRLAIGAAVLEPVEPRLAGLCSGCCDHGSEPDHGKEGRQPLPPSTNSGHAAL